MINIVRILFSEIFMLISIWFVVAVMRPTQLYAGSDVLLEDDKPALPGLPIRAATLSALTRFVVNVFGKYLSWYLTYTVSKIFLRVLYYELVT
jgi:hypothetical protein